MADIELVIKIPEDVYKRTVFYREFKDLNDCVTIIKALEKAIPLPKGHGRLIDADAFIDHLKNISKTQRYNEFIIDKKLTGLTVDDIFNAVCESLQNEGLAEGDSPTIIEADKEDEE